MKVQERGEKSKTKKPTPPFKGTLERQKKRPRGGKGIEAPLVGPEPKFCWQKRPDENDLGGAASQGGGKGGLEGGTKKKTRKKQTPEFRERGEKGQKKITPEEQERKGVYSSGQQLRDKKKRGLKTLSPQGEGGKATQTGVTFSHIA